MEIKYVNGCAVLKNAEDFKLRHIFDCGQTFRFDPVPDPLGGGETAYFGIAGSRALLISEHKGDIILHGVSEREFCGFWYDYFDLGRDYGQIKRTLACGDEIMKEAAGYGGGIRILRQDLWEMIISFIISASNNIPRIKGIIDRLCKNFGDKYEYMGRTYFSFPSAQKLAGLCTEELSVIRAGFRDKYILDAAAKAAGGELSLEYIRSLPSAEAKAELMKIKGVGNKVADCILLFGLGRTDAFPVDVWIKRIMEHCYFGREASVSEVSGLAHEKFGELGGFAQQYLFFWARGSKIGVG